MLNSFLVGIELTDWERYQLVKVGEINNEERI